MTQSRYALLLCGGLFVPSVAASGLGFWEWSASATALANANGAAATDATVASQLPAAMQGLGESQVLASVVNYQVTTDYELPLMPELGYQTTDPIPSMFAVHRQDQWSFGLGIHSRTAADIQVPQIRYLGQAEARLKPIVVSVAPSLSHSWGAWSLGVGGEWLVADYQLTSGDCHWLLGCRGWEQSGRLSGSSFNLSGHWRGDQHRVGVLWRAPTQFGNEEIDLDLPSMTVLSHSYQLRNQWQTHLSISHTAWEDRGVRFRDYADLFGLLVGHNHSWRVALGADYRWREWELRMGYSQEQAVDRLGGWDSRWRLGLGRTLLGRWQWDGSLMYERYAEKQQQVDPFTVAIENQGLAVSTSLSYRF
ncbi:OmpP1/FadL family transporter [Ferrimonas marina]|uniref:Long-chain fatty acid transport protein n=1 Tax=Ferrimonas marina TaxID=299255 RepID=A0A1M5NXQ5_9GAMM|nr:outer membrane protein transport protein [Ferrimonas marina]SHG94301.1 Long-chain fatty acid transport protein [Ferrimonas marina]